MAVRPGVKIVIDRVSDLGKAVNDLIGSRVAVGWPESTTSRKDDSGLTNAELAYIHDNGAPEAHIPARPMLDPGIRKSQAAITKRLEKAAQAALDGKRSEIDNQLAAVGLIASASIKNLIVEGIAPPLATSTIEGRLRRHPGRAGEAEELRVRAETGLPGTGNVTPLVDTGALKNAVSYAVRRAPKR